MSKSLISRTRPRPPRKDCKNRWTWRFYYERMADWYSASSEILCATYPFAAEAARIDAERFAQGVRSIDDATHPEILQGCWK